MIFLKDTRLSKFIRIDIYGICAPLTFVRFLSNFVNHKRNLAKDKEAEDCFISGIKRIVGLRAEVRNKKSNLIQNNWR